MIRFRMIPLILLSLILTVASGLLADETSDFKALESLYKNGAYQECINLCETYIKNNPKSTNYRNVLLFSALSAVKLGDNTNAISSLTQYDEVFNDDPKIDVVKYLLVKTYLDLRQPDVATEKYNDLKSRFPESPYTVRAEKLINPPAPIDTVPPPKEESKPQSSAVNLSLEELYLLYVSGRDSEFIIQARLFIKANKSSEDIPDILMILAICYAKTGQSPNAVSAIDILLKKYPDTVNTSDAYFLRSILRWEAGDNQGAQTDLLVLNTRFPNYERKAKVKTLLGALK